MITTAQRFRIGTLIGLLALVALACASSRDATSRGDDATTTSTRATTTTPGPKLQRGDKYVALGSSIASGYGISVQSTSCGRSSRSYPQIVAAHYGLTLTDVTCGAATIPNVVDKPQGDNPPQLGALTADTKLVTVSVGGNDIGYNGTAVRCADPATVCTAPVTLDADLATTRVALTSMLTKIRVAAPQATVVFVTYPREVPDGNCPALGFTDDEAAVVGSMGTQLESVFVEFGKSKDLTFVDPYVAPGDHTGCAASTDRWTAGSVPEDGFAYHPTALGHQTMAQMIEDALGS